MPAVLAVVAAIFGGMSLGAFLSDRLLRHTERPGQWYAHLELVIGAWNLLAVALIHWVDAVVPTLTGLTPSTFRQWLIAFAVPGLTLLPATAAMGATLPVIERFVAPLSRDGRSVGALYSANTLGAVSGILLSTVVLVPALGYARTVVLFACINLFCGSLVLVLESRFGRTAGSSKPFEEPGSISSKARPQILLALLLAATGFLGIGYEVLGVRVLAHILENTVYSYAAVLTVYLLGTAIGAGVYQSVFGHLNWDKMIGRLLLGLALAVWAGIWLLAHTPAIVDFARATFGSGLWGARFAELVTAGSVFLLPTLMMGATFAHLARLAAVGGLGLGRGLAVNTIGAAVAPVVFGVWLLPVLESRWAFAVLVLAYGVLGWSCAPREIWRGILALAAALALPTDFRLASSVGGETVAAYREGVMDSVSVLQQADGNRTLVVNNRFTMGGTAAALAERRHASVPLLFHPDPRRALFLGLGTGITFGATGAHPELKADGVELVPEVVEMLPWFKPQNALPDAPERFRVFVADARRFVAVCPDQYDVIVADLFHPARDGAGALYAVEHFRAIRSRLAPGGLFCQWLPLFQLNDLVLKIIIRTFLEVFPDGSAYLLRFNVDTPVIGLVGTLQPLRYGPDYFDERIHDQGLREQLREEQLRDAFHLFGCYVAGPKSLRRFCEGTALNTDDQPLVLFGAPAAQPSDRPGARLLKLLDSLTSDPGEQIDTRAASATEFTVRLGQFVRARDAYLRGLAAQGDGQHVQAADAFLESARLSPEFTMGYAQCVTWALQQFKSDPGAARKLLERLIEAQPSRPTAGELLQRLQQDH
jgi:spermidine synthase